MISKINPAGLALGAIIGLFASPYLLEAVSGFFLLIGVFHVIASILLGVLNIFAGITFFIVGGLILLAFIKFTPILFIILGALIGNWLGGYLSKN